MTQKKEAKAEKPPEAESAKNYFEVLNAVNVKDKIEKKNGLSYLSWAFAWGEIKKLHPDVSYKVYETETGCIYHTDGNTCWVKTGVTVNGFEHIEYLPVMDYKNQSITLAKVTSFEVNKAIQRSLTKAIARHGLGLYIYAGEDLPEDAKQKQDDDHAKALGGSVRDGVDAESEKAMYEQALKDIAACNNLDELKNAWKKIAKGKPVFTPEHWVDLEQAKDEAKAALPPF